MKSNNLDRNALISRLCHYYQSEGDSTEEALKKIRSELGSGYVSAIDSFESSLSLNREVASTKPNNGLSIISSLLDDINSQGGKNAQLFNITNEVLNRVNPSFKSCSRFFSALFLYPSIIFVISLIIYAMYKFFVFPTVVSNGFDDNVPRLTQFVFSDIASVVIIIVAIFLVSFFVWQMNHLAKSFSQIKPRKTLFGALFGTDQYHAYIVFLSYYKILLKCDVEPSSSFERAEKYSNLNVIKAPYYRSHRTALLLLKGRKAETALQEVEYQLEDVMQGLSHALATKQEHLLLSFQLLIMLFIGCMVIAMYLPIFKLASLF